MTLSFDNCYDSSLIFIPFVRADVMQISIENMSHHVVIGRPLLVDIYDSSHGYW